MAGWIPVLKASLPYVTQVVTAALPAFTSKPAPGQPEDVVPRQIAELQSAVTHNAESVKTLATQLKEAIEGIDAGAADLQRQLGGLRRLAVAALLVAIASFALAAWALIGR